jgi:hypothetical protein
MIPAATLGGDHPAQCPASTNKITVRPSHCATITRVLPVYSKACQPLLELGKVQLLYLNFSAAVRIPDPV